MHDSRKVFLLDTEPRCILATYEKGDNAQTTEFKTWDDDIKVDDYVTVPTETRHKMTVVKVVEVDVEAILDSEAPMGWIVGVVDTTAFDETASQEKEFLEAARSAEKTRRKAQLKKDFLQDVDTTQFSAISHSPNPET